MRRARPKPLLVGEYNPLSSRPEHALFPRPRGCAGARLAAILGMTEDEYLAAFDRLNLLTGAKYKGGKWSVPDARRAAASVLEDLLAEEYDPDGRRRPVRRPLVLLGKRVSAAFGVEYWPFGPPEGTAQAEGPKGVVRPALVLPHPSGLCRIWNNPDAKDRARAAVRALL